MNKKHFYKHRIYQLPVTAILMLLFFAANLNAQTVIQGRIINFDQEPIAFASIVHAESGTGTAADARGNFSLELKGTFTEGNLLISAVGYNARKVRFEAPNDKVEFKLIHLTENTKELKEVVVTGEVKPTPVDSSIYKVKLISLEKIQRSGAQNLNELLMTEANIRMSTDLILGSQIEMMGLDGQNVKIMVDGVPVIGRLDGNIDLSQINLDNIQQVEVVEGPMSVVYGNNALAGTINLITKQHNYHNFEAQVKGYVESVGRYSGDLSLSQKVGKNTFSADGGYEYFSGVDFDDSDRSMDWKPKTQYRANLAHNWKNEKWQLSTKLGYANEELLYKSDIYESYKVYDTHYYTNRYNASFGINGGWNENNHLNAVAAYSIYTRAEQEEYKDLTTLQSTWGDKERTQDMNQKMLRAIHDHTFVPRKLSLQSGTDINIEGMKGDRVEGGDQSIGDYALFANLRYTPLSAVELQPGLRYSYNTEYNSPLVYSLNAKWNFSRRFTWRASFAKGFRAPSLKELYYVFVDSNHEIYGNSELEAESSYNYNTALEFASSTQNHAWKVATSLFYNDISNLITLVQEENTTAYSYENIDDYKSIGGDFSIDYAFKKQLKLRGGYGITGRYNSYSSSNGSTKYNLTHDVFAGIKYTDRITRLSLNIDYKYSGSVPYFYTDDDDGQIKEGEQEAYHTLNASINRTFLQHQLQLILGAKNIFDVTTVDLVGEGSGTHSSSDGTPISYGRSFFITLNYKLYK